MGDIPVGEALEPLFDVGQELVAGLAAQAKVLLDPPPGGATNAHMEAMAFLVSTQVKAAYALYSSLTFLSQSVATQAVTDGTDTDYAVTTCQTSYAETDRVVRLDGPLQGLGHKGAIEATAVVVEPTELPSKAVDFVVKVDRAGFPSDTYHGKASVLLKDTGAFVESVVIAITF